MRSKVPINTPHLIAKDFPHLYKDAVVCVKDTGRIVSAPVTPITGRIVTKSVRVLLIHFVMGFLDERNDFLLREERAKSSKLLRRSGIFLPLYPDILAMRGAIVVLHLDKLTRFWSRKFVCDNPESRRNSHCTLLTRGHKLLWI
jgi:hypothetical protein